jgi:hypothetical protein
MTDDGDHPRPEWIHNRFDAALRLPPLWNGVRDPMEGIRPSLAERIGCGSIEQFYRSAFVRGAHDGLREAYRQCCPSCRPLVSAIANRYSCEAA